MMGKLARVRVLMGKNREIVWRFWMVREERVLIRKWERRGGGGICINRAKLHLSTSIGLRVPVLNHH